MTVTPRKLLRRIRSGADAVLRVRDFLDVGLGIRFAPFDDILALLDFDVGAFKPNLLATLFECIIRQHFLEH